MSEAAETQPTTPEAVQVEQVADEADYSALMEPEPTNAETPAQQQATEQPTTDAEPQGEAAEPVAQDQPQGEQQPQPGTPDKALQKFQQDLGAVTRKLDALLEKQQSGQPLTATEQQQAVKAQRKLDELRTKVAGKQFDVIDNGEDLAEGLIETDQTVQTLQQQVAQLSQVVGQQQAQARWAEIKATFPHVKNPEAVYQKCVEEAQQAIGADNPALYNLASRDFYARMTAANKSVQAKSQPNRVAPQPPGRVTVAPTTGPAVGNQAMSEDQRIWNDYMALVKE